MFLRRHEFRPVCVRGQFASLTTRYAQPIIYRAVSGDYVCARCAGQLGPKQIVAGQINYVLTACDRCQASLSVAR